MIMIVIQMKDAIKKKHKQDRNEGCNETSECKPGEICDKPSNTCRKPCNEKKDRNGYGYKQTCDTNKGFCVDGKIYIQ